jgi:hypothetical protein
MFSFLRRFLGPRSEDEVSIERLDTDTIPLDRPTDGVPTEKVYPDLIDDSSITDEYGEEV